MGAHRMSLAAQAANYHYGAGHGGSWSACPDPWCVTKRARIPLRPAVKQEIPRGSAPVIRWRLVAYLAAALFAAAIVARVAIEWW